MGVGAGELAHAEPESAALRRWLDVRAETGWISSVLTEFEAFRALARYAPGAVSRLPAVLDQIDLINLDPRIRILAQAVQSATVQPGCYPSRHSLPLRDRADLVRDLRQAAPGRGPGGGPPSRLA